MKILVVDDEYLVRESIVINLKSIGYTDIVEAGNGNEALAVIAHSTPDIILADIKMPEKDGIELLSELRSKNSNIIYIIVSGYDLFEYAQSAIKLGAFSYILKPVKYQELSDVMTKAVQKLEYDKELLDDNLVIRVKARQGMELLQKQFLAEILKENSSNMDYINSKLNELNIHFRNEMFLVAIISFDNYTVVFENLNSQDKILYKLSIENIATGFFTGLNIVSYSFPIDDGQGFILNFSESNSIYTTDIFQKTFHEIKDSIKEFLNEVTVTIGLSKPFNNLEYFKQSFEAARNAVNIRLVNGLNQVFISEESYIEKKVIKSIDFKTEQALLLSFERLDHTSGLKIIEEMYSQFKNSHTLDLESLTKLNFQLILLIYKIMKQLNIDLEEMFGDEFTLYNQVNSCPSIDAIINWFDKKLQECILKISISKQSANTRLISSAMEYIRANYNKDLSLETVSNYVHMSSSYFGKLFKQEFGQNFLDYLISYRITKAREYLKQGIYKSNEVSKMVGFNDDKYFYKAFKKHTGITPGEYKGI